MTTVDRIVWSTLLLFGIFVVCESLQLRYQGDFGPGPGFFSLWLGVLVIGLALLELAKTVRRRREPLPQGFLPDRAGIRRILSVVGALVGALFLMEWLGFSLTMLFFSVFLLRTLGRQPWWLTFVLALAGSFGTAFLFRQLLVMLPRGILGI
ncbi:MAG: tripartite tricarboxylate transporter TctB family protein [Thermodesulfobacteriota bacterium]